jgi:hypothetical protein
MTDITIERISAEKDTSGQNIKIAISNLITFSIAIISISIRVAPIVGIVALGTLTVIMVAGAVSGMAGFTIREASMVEIGIPIIGAMTF